MKNPYWFDQMDGLLDWLERDHCVCGAYEIYLIEEDEVLETWTLCGIHSKVKELRKMAEQVTSAETKEKP